MFEKCRVYRVEGECYEDEHHQYWPKPEYRQGIAKKFAGLIINRTIMCRQLHNEQHRLPPPEKPSPGEMQKIIDAYE